jgi:hypothetical protein
MIAYVVRSIAVLVSVFALAIGLIRAQPYDTDEIRAFFIPPPGCEPPCWMGIRPGTTTLDEAKAVIEAYYGVLQGPPTVQRWEWNEATPLFIRSKVGRLVLWDEVVLQIELPDVIGLSDVLITFGTPAWGRMRYDQMETIHSVYYELYYPELGNRPLIVDADCRTPLTQIMVSYRVQEGSPPPHGETYDLPRWLHTYCD